MFNLLIKNDYYYSFLLYYGADGNMHDRIINRHDKNTISGLTNAYMNIPGIGAVNFTYLGEDRLSGCETFPIEKYGVLIRVHTSEVCYRFDNQGDLELTVSKYGGCSLQSKNGTLVQVDLSELIINPS